MRPHLLKHGAIPWVGVAFGAIHVPIQRLQVVMIHRIPNVEGHPAAEKAGIQKEGWRGLDAPTCSMSSLWEWVRDAWSNGNRPVDKILKIAICVWLVNLAVHLLLICKVLINLL